MTDLYPWLTGIRTALAERLAKDELPHALLLGGPVGVGKMALAADLSATLLCEQRTTRQEPCGSCTGCRLYAAGSHPDFLLVTPEVDEKSGKQSATIKVDQVRALIDRLGLSSHRTGYKVAILAPAEAMNASAANSLLKTLEEPTDNTVLVLVCTVPARLPATIRSRCQQVRIPIPPAELAASWLGRELPGADTVRYLQMAGGAPLVARELAAAGAVEQRQQQLQVLIEVLDGRIDPLVLAARWAREEDLQRVYWLRDWLMDLVRIRLSGTTGSIYGRDLEEKLAGLARRLEARDLFRQLDRINRVLQVPDGVLNRLLMTEEILLSWAGRN